MQASSNGILLACVCETLRYELDQAHSVEQTSAKICKVFEIGLLALPESCPPNWGSQRPATYLWQTHSRYSTWIGLQGPHST
jgi:hypothetical protein